MVTFSELALLSLRAFRRQRRQTSVGSSPAVSPIVLIEEGSAGQYNRANRSL